MLFGNVLHAQLEQMLTRDALRSSMGGACIVGQMAASAAFIVNDSLV
jgi:hypothetical protein